MDVVKTRIVGDDDILQPVKHGQSPRVDGVEAGHAVDDHGGDGGGEE